MMFSSIISVTILAVPHRLILAATESACCLVLMIRKNPMVLSIIVLIFFRGSLYLILASTKFTASHH